MSAAQGNRLLEDVAQLTRVCPKIWLRFPTVASGDTTVTSHTSVWGQGSGFHPTTITRSGVGIYAITYPSSFSDALSVSETVSFTYARADIMDIGGSDYGWCQCTTSGNVINLHILDEGGGTMDPTVGTIILVTAR